MAGLLSRQNAPIAWGHADAVAAALPQALTNRDRRASDRCATTPIWRRGAMTATTDRVPKSRRHAFDPSRSTTRNLRTVSVSTFSS
jgi:hypothetical protein